MLSQSRWIGADVAKLIEEEVAPYRTNNTRISAIGPPLNVPPDKAQTMALIIHELATNAAKYGALSQPGGELEICWRLDGDFLIVRWIENGGPPVSVPQTRGFGTKIIGASLHSQRGEAAQFDWNPNGLRCTIRLLCNTSKFSHTGKARKAVADGPNLYGHAGNKQILVVEDEAIIGMLTCDHLTELGYQVAGPFSDLGEAIAAANSRQFDGAVLDVNLGGDFVFPLAHALRKQQVPFVFMTGYREDILEDGFSDVPILRKPVSSHELESALGHALNGASEPVLAP